MECPGLKFMEKLSGRAGCDLIGGQFAGVAGDEGAILRGQTLNNMVDVGLIRKV